MNPPRPTIFTTASLLLLTLFTLSARSQEPMPYPGAEELAGALFQHHGGLLGPEEYAQLDRLNREIRQFGRAADQAQTDEARATAQADRSERAADLLAMIGRISSLRDLALPAPAATLPKPEPVTLPGDTGSLIFRINKDAGNPACIAIAMDFADGLSTVRTPEIDPARTSYVLLSLHNAPARTTSIVVEFRTADGAAFSLPVDLATPAPGRLQLTVISDDTGDPAPAMVRLYWLNNRSDYRPRNALDFTPQFDSQSGMSTGKRFANLHGALRGNYWCVPGPVDMVLPPGDWEVVVRRGTEHIPVIDRFTVSPGGAVERSYRPKRWVDMRESGWYSGDDHVHFQILSDFDARQLMTWLMAEDVHLGNALKMGDMYRTWFEQRGFGPDYRIQEGDYIIVPGQECPRTHNELGHTISLNITDMVRDTARYYQYDSIFEQVSAQGGLSGFAHVNSGIFHVHRGMTLVAPKGLIDFVELLQFAQLGTDLYYDFLNLGIKVTASAGSDVPWGGTVGEVRVYAYTGPGQFTADTWFDAVERGRTFVTNGPMIDLRVDDALPGDEIAAAPGKTVRIRARAWGAEGFTTPVKLEIVQHGEVIHTVEAGPGGAPALEAEIELDPAGGCWIAARAEATEGYRAHTTPVYVVREGFRFWKYDSLDALLAKRGASLDEIDTVIADALARQAQGAIGADKWIEELALQAEALKERVREARAAYEALRETFAREAAARGTLESARP